MRLRIIGSADLVRLWARRLESLGFVGSEYPARGGGQVRWYGELDDRTAARMDPRQEPLDFSVSDNRDKPRRARKVKVSVQDTQAAGLAPTLPAPPRKRLGKGKL